MSYQVGFACYADLASAGVAACNAFSASVVTVASGESVSLACVSSDANGVLTIARGVWAQGSIPTYSAVQFTQTPVYAPCMYQDFVDAGLSIFVALLVVWASYLGYKKIIDFLSWGRGCDD